MKITELWAKGLLLLSRGARYISIINMLMMLVVFYHAIRHKNIAVALCILAVISVTALSIFDYIFILGKENKYTWRKNDEWTELRDSINQIKEDLKEIKNDRQNRD